jgi:hypothetical protein
MRCRYFANQDLGLGLNLFRESLEHCGQQSGTDVWPQFLIVQ